MKEKFTIPYPGFFLFVFPFVFFFLNSCSKEKDPVYAGTWQHVEQVNSDGLVLNTTRTIIFSRKNYEETFLVRREGSNYISEILGTRGNIIGTRSGIVFELDELGTCSRDASDNCTENVEWHGEGSQYWEENIPFFTIVVPGNIQVEGDILMLVRDLNADGDTEDAGENISFQRI
jgi:hypothetical protein